MSLSSDDLKDIHERKDVLVEGFLNSITMDGMLLNPREEYLATIAATLEVTINYIVSIVSIGCDKEGICELFMKTMNQEIERRIKEL